MPEFTLKQLETFSAVAELNSFTRAADELYLTQSTVSAHISSLESALGVRLFSRDTKRRVQLTPEGQRIYPAAKRVLADCRELKKLSQNDGAALPLLLGASTVPAQYVLPELLSVFLKRYPDCRYLLKRGDSDQIHELLLSGEIRVGFVGTTREQEGFSYVPIAKDRLVLVTENSDKYRAMQRSGIFGRELLGEPTVAREEGSGTDRTVIMYLRKIEFPMEKLHIVARIDNPETIKNMVARGSGVSVLSALAVQEDVAAGKLLSFEMDPKGLLRNIYMVYREDLPYSERERQFLHSIRLFAQKALDID